MKNIFRVLCILCIPFSIYSWGFWAHQRINRMAVFTLPPELFPFYKKHIEYITIHAVDPDKRRYSDPEEAPRHYIDLDRYGDNPFDSLPVLWDKAVEKIGEDTLKAHGIVPWHIGTMVNRLTYAFKNKDVNRIIKLSAELGHYVGDAHVPLHCTRNYNGQLTGQHGIHGLWESRLPELFGEEYDYLAGRAAYIEKPLLYAWSIVKTSYASTDSVLFLEKELSNEFPSDRKYAYEVRGSQTVRVYSKEYADAYRKKLNGMESRRMLDAIIATGNLWYTCWVNAGMPDMNAEGFVFTDTIPEPAIKLNTEQKIPGHED